MPSSGPLEEFEDGCGINFQPWAGGGWGPEQERPCQDGGGGGQNLHPSQKKGVRKILVPEGMVD